VTDDIVTRLIAEIADASSETSMTLLAEAADEIIRWRAEVRRLVSLRESAKKKDCDLDVLGLLRKYEHFDSLKKQAADEIERLREKNTILFDALRAVTKGKAVYFTDSTGKTVTTDAQNSWMDVPNEK
jgi:hypothetical protein